MAEIKKIKPSLPKGTRDFLPEEVAKRNYIFDTIKSVFRKYGFQQIDTPAFERLETLTGKYGEEGDRLLFKILNSGDPFKDITDDDIPYLSKQRDVLLSTLVGKYLKDFTQKNYDRIIQDLNKIAQNIPDINNISPEVTKSLGGLYSEEILKTYEKEIDNDIQKGVKKIALKLTEKGLRYDLTVPLARYVVQHQSDLAFPFKRFHIGPVWRADRPQKGRYQEFYQCDADVIGSTSLLNEVELTQIYSEAFSKLGMDVTVRVNHRKLIDEILTHAGITENKATVITLLDKLDKISWDGDNGIATQIKTNGASEEQLSKLSKALFETTYSDFKGVYSDAVVSEIEYVMSRLGNVSNVQFDPTLMRGLDYYTGMVWEVRPNNVQMGSLGGGGRYDNLTEMFGGRDLSGVGISFGVERIYDVMEELKLFPATLVESTKVLFVHFDEASEAYAFDQLQKVRAQDIASEIYPGKKKLDKQMNYANDKKIPYVVVIGGDEMASSKLTFKNMSSGEQQKLTIEEIIEQLKGN